jgi:predicted metalloprotease with PDZ domain
MNQIKFTFSARCIALLLFSFTVAAAQETTPLRSITYRLSMSRPVSHLFEVEIEIELPDPLAQSIDMQMPKWSPGRYAVADFAKNVEQFEALGGICPRNAKCQLPDFPVTRVDDQTWRISTMNTHSLTVRYKVFGNDLSGTFSQLNNRHANFNGGSIFMYIAGHKPDPVKLLIEPPNGWRVVNGWTQRTDQREWSFANYDLLIDTPTEIGPDWTSDQFVVDGKHYHVVIHALGKDGGKRANLVRDIEKIVRAETAMLTRSSFTLPRMIIRATAWNI